LTCPLCTGLRPERGHRGTSALRHKQKSRARLPARAHCLRERGLRCPCDCGTDGLRKNSCGALFDHSPHSPPTRAPFSATERFIQKTTGTSRTGPINWKDEPDKFDPNLYGVLCDRLGRLFDRLGLERRARPVSNPVLEYFHCEEDVAVL